MLWQAEDDFAFRLLGGYAWHPGPGGYTSGLPSPMSPRGTQQLLANEEGVSLFGPELPVSPKLVADTRTVVSRYDVRVVIVDRSMTGSGPVMELFRDALGRPMLSVGRFSMWANWHGWPTREQFSHDLSTRVLGPANDSKLSGTVALDARTAGYYPVTKVEFLLSGDGLHGEVIAEGNPTWFGSIARWNTTSVANGRYSLQSMAYDAFGASSLSRNITITIDNYAQRGRGEQPSRPDGMVFAKNSAAPRPGGYQSSRANQAASHLPLVGVSCHLDSHRKCSCAWQHDRLRLGRYALPSSTAPMVDEPCLRGALVAALVVTQLPQWPYSTKQILATLPITTR